MSNMLTIRSRKAVVAVALVAGSLSLAACGSSADANSSDSSSSASASKPKPVASIDALQGESTAITLDQGFVDALTSLKLTPGTVGEATLADGALSFPITGGNVTVYKPGTVSPYDQGRADEPQRGPGRVPRLR